MDENKAHYVVATGIIIKAGKYLITKRAGWEKAFPGLWTVPGGKLEVKDYINKQKDTGAHWYNILENLLKREIEEETGLKIKNIKYLTSMTFIRPDNIPVLIVSLYADYDSGEVKLCDALTEYAWVSLDEAKNYSLIEGIYEEIDMLDKYLKGEGIGEWHNLGMNVVEEVRKFVEEECKKPESKYGYEPYTNHFVPTAKYALFLASKMNADKEIVEIAAWLHDIGSIIYGRENHHITSCEVAERKLTELGYPKNRIEQVKHCIFAHRGSQNIKRETKEAQALADADAMNAFDHLEGQFRAAFVSENLNQEQARISVLKKIENSYEKLSSEGKELVKNKFDAILLLLK